MTGQYRIESKTELRAGSTTAASWRAAPRSAGASASSCSWACTGGSYGRDVSTFWKC